MQCGSGGVLYRPLHPSDYAALKLLHQRLFPLDYDDHFFAQAVHGMDGIVAWAASAPLPALTHIGGDVAPQLLPPHPGLPASVALPPSDRLQQQGQQEGAPSTAAPSDVLAGFITARSFQALYADPRDRQLLGIAGRDADQQQVLYVLTLGVAQPHQRQGIARRLLGFALKYAAEISCRAVYLHVAAFNQPARAFYKSAGFRELAVLPDFYTIRTGRQPQPSRERYDACLLGCIICPPPPTPWNAVNMAVAPLTAVMHELNSCLPWGDCTARKAGAASGAAGAAAGEGGQRQEGGAETDVEEGGAPAAGGSSSCAAARQQHQTQPRPAPEWLKGLFTRR